MNIPQHSSPQRILISGASGLVGKALSDFLKQKGHEVWTLVRRPAKASSNEIFWDPSRGELAVESVSGFDAIINLSGENIAAGRWTDNKKKKLLESRTQTTGLLASTISGCAQAPKVFISASATGYYGDRGAEELTEESAPGSNFLSEICLAWERAAEAAKSLKTRVVVARLGVVLSPKGGALQKMLLPFRCGLGSRLGPGTQYMSWISLPDLISVLYFLLISEKISGAVNCVTSSAVTNAEFSKTLAGALHRPMFLSAPARILKLLLGEMADELLLCSFRVVPKRLLEAGFQFAHPNLKVALEALLEKK